MKNNLLNHFILTEEQEETIRKALRKSAEYLLQTPEYKGYKKYTDVDPEESLMNIMNTYLEIPQLIKKEAELRAKKKMVKYWKQFGEFSKGVEMSIKKLNKN